MSSPLPSPVLEKTPSRPVTLPAPAPAPPTKSRRWALTLGAVALALLFGAASSVCYRHFGSPRIGFTKAAVLDNLVSPPGLFGGSPHNSNRVHQHHHAKRQQPAAPPAPQVNGVSVSGIIQLSATPTLNNPSATNGGGLGVPTLNAGSSIETPPAIPATPWPVPNPFPQPWDSSLTLNFSQSSCLSFFTNTMANNTFRACRALSLLLPASSAFFQTQQNLTGLTATIGGTCATTGSAGDCQTVMDDLAAQIVKPSVCAQDLDQGHPIAKQALTGFQSYTVMREAGCLINQRTNSYCFVDAVASVNGPSDLYYYSLPLGQAIPPSTPSCSACIQSLMSLYASFATNKTTPLHDTYFPAAQQANDKCGDSYAPIVSSFTNGAVWTQSSSWMTLLGLAFTAVLFNFS